MYASHIGELQQVDRACIVRKLVMSNAWVALAMLCYLIYCVKNRLCCSWCAVLSYFLKLIPDPR